MLLNTQAEEAESLAGSLSKYFSAQEEQKDGNGKSNQTIDAESTNSGVTDIEIKNSND